MVRLGQGLESPHFPPIHLPTLCREAGGPHPAAPARHLGLRESRDYLRRGVWTPGQTTVTLCVILVGDKANTGKEGKRKVASIHFQEP